MCLFVLASYLTFQQSDLNNDKHYSRLLRADSANTLLVEVNELPIERERFTRIPVKLLAFKSRDIFEPVVGKTFLYVRRSSAMGTVQPGDRLVFTGKFSEIQPPQNPNEFDYKNYLFYRNIYHTVFLDPVSFAKVHVDQVKFSVWTFGLKCKKKVLNSLRESGLSQEAFSICSALITGYDDEIDQSVMEAFSHSGTLHVLSVSGLHVGLIYLVINFILQRADPHDKRKFFRFLISCFALWTFALITGFSSPVLRATLMFTLLGFGKIYFRSQRNNQLNILLTSAFVLLFVNPFYLMDIGFLLSYLALFGLIYFQPALAKLWAPENTVLTYLWQSTSASLAATISTLPVTLYFFKQFPLWFFFCNMVVVPATFLLMGLATLILCNCVFLVPFTNSLVKWLIEFIGLFNGETGYIDRIDFNGTDAVLLTLFIFLISIAVQYHSYLHLRHATFALIAWQLISLVYSYKAKTSVCFSVYKLKGTEAYLFKNGQTVYFDPPDRTNYKRHIEPHLTEFNYPLLQQQRFNYLKWGNWAILVCGGKTAIGEQERLVVNTIVITGNYKISPEELSHLKGLKRLVIGSDNSQKTARYTEELSRKFKLDFYNVKQSGCWLFYLN